MNHRISESMTDFAKVGCQAQDSQEYSIEYITNSHIWKQSEVEVRRVLARFMI
jgi:hypothetical protein